jgi:hypothetical protein
MQSFTKFRVWNTEHSAICHARTCEKAVLYFSGIDIDAARDHHVRCTIAPLTITLCV